MLRKLLLLLSFKGKAATGDCHFARGVVLGETEMGSFGGDTLEALD
jgi:hypothetical protein